MARIYQTATVGEANLRVAVVDARGEADLLVYRAGSWGTAYGDSRWFITRDRQDATACVYFTTPGFAQVRICFVDNHSEAGWQKQSPYHGRFG